MTDPQCNDGIFCTLDRCLFGQCSNVHNDGQCNDGLFCNGEEFCDAVADACASGMPPTCGGNLFCSDIFDRCVQCESNAQCSDGLFCNGTEICNSGLCQNGSPVDCSFLDTECIEGVCNETVDQCQQGPPCFDNNLCTEDNCVPGVGCAHPPTYDVPTECCNPATGGVVLVTDNNACTTDICNPQTGQVSHTVNSCNDNNACTINDLCINNGAGCVGTHVNTLACSADANCPRGICNSATGMCKCTPCSTNGPCNDNIACTSDTCNTTVGYCVNAPNDASCATGLFCSQQRCNRDVGCQIAGFCTPTAGNPCPTAANCNEATDNCGGCLPPTVSATSRYLNIIPPAAGAVQMAIRVEGDCQDSDVSCVARYVDFDNPLNGTDPTTARLVVAPVYKTAAQWGTVNLRGVEIVPDTSYRVRMECNPGAVRSAGVLVRTWLFGDTNNTANVNFTDINRVVQGFQNLFSGSLLRRQVDLTGVANCEPNVAVNFADVSMDVDAFRGTAFPCSTDLCP